MDEVSRLMTLGEVAAYLRVDPKTVSRWCRKGRLPSVRTPGGHHRVWATDLAEALASLEEPSVNGWTPP